MNSAPMNSKMWRSGRLSVYLAATTGACIIGTLFSSFNFGWVCMVNATATNPSEEDEYGGSLTWDQDIQRLLFACYSIGGLLMSLPIGVMVNRLGARLVYAGCAGIGGIATLFIPMAANRSYIIVAFLRIVIGFASTAYWPVTFAVCAHWAPKAETGLTLAIVSSGFQIGIFVGFLFAGLECTYIGWEWIFYITGIASLSFACFWFIFYRNNPKGHMLISADEAAYIDSNRSKKTDKSNIATPWIHILTSLPVWACIICRFLATYISYTVNTFTPTYLKQTSTLGPLENGYLSSLPLFCQLLARLSAGYLSDKLVCWTPTIRLKAFNSFAFFGSAIFSLCLTFVQDSTPIAVSIIFLCGIMSTIVFCTGGFMKAPLLIAPQYTAVIASLMNISGMAGAIVMPIVVATIAPSWNIVFYISLGLGLAGTLTFVVFGSGRQQKWSKEPEKEKDSVLKVVPVIIRF